MQAADDRDRVIQAGVHPLPLPWPRTTQFITGLITLALCQVRYDYESRVSDRRELITKANGIGWGPAGWPWANYCQDPVQEPETEQTGQRQKLALAPQSKTAALTWETELAMGPEITAYQYCHIELSQEEPSEFQGIHGKVSLRTSLNISYWDDEFRDCSHQQLPHHPQCECPDCDQISWDITPAPGRPPVEIRSRSHQCASRHGTSES